MPKMADSTPIGHPLLQARAAVMKQRHSLQKELERTRNRLRIVEHQLRKVRATLERVRACLSVSLLRSRQNLFTPDEQKTPSFG